MRIHRSRAGSIAKDMGDMPHLSCFPAAGLLHKPWSVLSICHPYSVSGQDNLSTTYGSRAGARQSLLWPDSCWQSLHHLTSANLAPAPAELACGLPRLVASRVQLRCAALWCPGSLFSAGAPLYRPARSHLSIPERQRRIVTRCFRSSPLCIAQSKNALALLSPDALCPLALPFLQSPASACALVRLRVDREVVCARRDQP